MDGRRNLEWEREQVKRRLSTEVTELLQAAAEALERLAPAEFETIGARALDLDRLIIHAAAAAALPGSRLLDAGAPLRSPDPELYSTTDWAATGERLQTVAGRLLPSRMQPVQLSQERSVRRMVFAGSGSIPEDSTDPGYAGKEMLWRL